MRSLYIHIPFCDRKCFYCSFAVVVGQLKRGTDYLHCLSREASLYDAQFVRSIYIGGGTPSTLNPEQIAQLFQIIHGQFSIGPNCEVTVEMNPEGLTRNKLSAFKAQGVNRISLGIQTFHDRYLKYLGRIHDAQAALYAFDLVREAGFDNISCDLMISFPEQTMGELKADLNQMLALRPEHVSLYSLTIEPYSRFFVQQVQPAPDEVQVEQLELTVSTMDAQGFPRYEVSNFAQPGKASVHNINYWECGDYIGLGMGAHSHLDGERFYNVNKFADYIKLIKEGQSPRHATERLTHEQRMVEALLFGFRMTRGVQLAKLEARYGCQLDAGRQEKVASYIKEGLLEAKDGYLRATAKGMLLLDGISGELF